MDWSKIRQPSDRPYLRLNGDPITIAFVTEPEEPTQSEFGILEAHVRVGADDFLFAPGSKRLCFELRKIAEKRGGKLQGAIVKVTPTGTEFDRKFVCELVGSVQ